VLCEFRFKLGLKRSHLVDKSGDLRVHQWLHDQESPVGAAQITVSFSEGATPRMVAATVVEALAGMAFSPGSTAIVDCADRAAGRRPEWNCKFAK
jgi:hypothetical protein